MKTTLATTIFILFSISLLATQSVFAGSLVAYWPFDEGSGDETKDSSDNGNDGQVNGAEWVDGKFGQALKFDGVDNFVLVLNDDSYNFGKDDSFSISLWINYEPKGDWQGVLQKFNGGYPFKVEINPSNSLYFALWDQTNNPGAHVGNVSGSWHHVAFVRDRSEKKLYSYLDSALNETKDDTITGTIKNATDLYIGARKPGNTITYKGVLDEIAIYSRILTESEIKQAANGNLPEVASSVTSVDKLTTTWGILKKSR